MSSLYKAIIRTVDPFVPARFQPLWQHPAGPKTVFFWGPIFKWGLVIAGLADMSRPPDMISAQQAGAIMASGFIWARYSMVIIPVNWNLFSVNMFVALLQGVQLYRAVSYQHYYLNKK